MHTFQELLDSLSREEPVYIQTHNFPDHDAVAAAFGLQNLFKALSIQSFLIYEGEIQRDSLQKMIHDLGIEIKHQREYPIKESDKIIIVDGCKGNKNVTDLVGDEIAIIDHHEVSRQEDVPFNDIRPYYGACASIIFSYYEDLGIEIDRKTATALKIGIDMDTASLTRGVSREDMKAYYNLFSLADNRMVNSVLRNYIQEKDLTFYKYAMEHIKIERSIAWCYFEEGCNQNLMGIIGDFFLALREVDFVILVANNGEKINFSLRNERDEWNASLVIQAVLEGIGFGGGHIDMAGGIIKDRSLFNEQEIYESFMKHLFPG
jgi:nanoRNase/pAp phosphatase (c-di-AMP/oligoRNAs hydrolase)